MERNYVTVANVGSYFPRHDRTSWNEQSDIYRTFIEFLSVQLKELHSIVQRYGVSCTAQSPSPAEPREEAPHYRPHFNL